jgi:hypothetical protein
LKREAWRNIKLMSVTAPMPQLFIEGTVVSEEHPLNANDIFVVPVMSGISDAVIVRLLAP